mgnify:FL=1
MAAILISIKKQYSDLIFEGSKTVEYRKVLPSKPVDRCFIYESRGSGRVVGFFTLSKTTSCSPEEAWSLTCDIGALSRTQFDTYYEGRSKSVLFYIASCHRFDKPFELSELGLNRAPQSFIYLSDAEADQLESRPSYSINERFNSI